jgi:hypothetical protein
MKDKKFTDFPDLKAVLSSKSACTYQKSSSNFLVLISVSFLLGSSNDFY